MKCEIIESEKKSVLPEVGQPWACSKDGPVYIRINDEIGARHFKDNEFIPTENVFFSWDVTSQAIVYSLKDASNIILLEQVEPAKFKVKE